MIDREIADRISDRMVAVINSELALMREHDCVDFATLLAGQCLGMLAMLRQGPEIPRPASLVGLDIAITRVMHDIAGADFDPNTPIS